MRNLLRETRLHPHDFILPIFVNDGIQQATPIPSMPGVFNYPESRVGEVVRNVWDHGVQAVLLFGVTAKKDPVGGDTLREDGLMARMIREAKSAAPELLVISDNCFCEYTDHGHCGVLRDGDVDNDATLENLGRQAVIAAKAGADLVSPSAMMDGQVAAMREELDDEGFPDVGIMSYSTKFASAFYGPFRDAVDSTFKGSRNTYQMDAANRREALDESLTDEEEGADILMVKPAMPYLDVIREIREATELPIAAYQVSGEYAMIKSAASSGALDEKAVALESLTSIKRAGADIVITYFALEAAEWIATGA
jgi:porphobilinogen synthase